MSYEITSIFLNLPDDCFTGSDKAAALHYAGKALPKVQKPPKANEMPVVQWRLLMGFRKETSLTFDCSNII